MDLTAATDFHRGDTLSLDLGGPARKIVLRLLPTGGDHTTPTGIEGGIIDIPADGRVMVVLQADHPQTAQLSVHGGSKPFGIYDLGGANGAAVLHSVAVSRPVPSR